MRVVLPKEPEARSWQTMTASKPALPHSLLAHVGHMLSVLPLGRIHPRPQRTLKMATQRSRHLELKISMYVPLEIAQCIVFPSHIFKKKRWWENAGEKKNIWKRAKMWPMVALWALLQTNVCEYFCKTNRILFAICCMTLEREYLKLQAHICRKSSTNYEKTEKMDIKCSNICRGFFNSSKSKRNEKLVKGE